MQSTANYLQYASLCKNVNKHKPVIFQCLVNIYSNTPQNLRKCFCIYAK